MSSWNLQRNESNPRFEMSPWYWHKLLLGIGSVFCVFLHLFLLERTVKHRLEAVFCVYPFRSFPSEVLTPTHFPWNRLEPLEPVPRVEVAIEHRLCWVWSIILSWLSALSADYTKELQSYGWFWHISFCLLTSWSQFQFWNWFHNEVSSGSNSFGCFVTKVPTPENFGTTQPLCIVHSSYQLPIMTTKCTLCTAPQCISDI